ncbi:Sugar transporter SWEET1 [Holothuria leucospilota]|uniref:Sugar transporter SWEET n=1 Tax=Holothuria leucospilota TaxID=206669 RepID=A0A9Q0YFG6_HOLLE|nr:Sugar transporter SWEET1 [Holothuria leucospilota]
MDLLSLLSTVATVSTILLFLTGVQICRQIKDQGNTKNIPIFPFLSMCVSATFWLKYGILKGDSVIMFVNSTGMTLGMVYLVVYYVYSTSKEHVYKMLAYAGLIVFPVLLYIKMVVPDKETSLSHLGFVCSVGTILMYGSPLVSVSQVVRNKSTEYLSFPLCLANFLVSGMWFIYGRMVDDLVMQIPNFIGSLLGLIQVSLFALYPSGAARKYDMSGTGSII